MNRAALAVATAALAVIIGGVWWAGRSVPASTTLPAPAAAVAPTPTVAAAPDVRTAPSLPACRFTVGQRLGYDVRNEVSVKLAAELARFGGAEAPRDTVTTTELTMEVLRVDAAGAVLLARVTGLEATAGEEVKSPWLVRVNARCEVAGFARHHATTRSAGRQQQAYLHELWFSLPGATATPVAFENSTGAATGLVRAGDGVVVRTIATYERVFVPSMNGVVVKDSRLEVKRGDAPWFEHLRGVEETSVPGLIVAGHSVFEATSKAADASQLSSASRNEADYVWQNLLGAAPDGRLHANAMPEDHRARVEAMKSVTLDQALERMGGTIAAGVSMDQQWRDMSAFLDAHPEELPAFAEAVVTEFPPSWKGMGYLAISHTENAEARELLLTILREPNAPAIDRSRASLALVTRHDVGLPLARELVTLSRTKGDTKNQQEFAQNALLYAGMLSGLRPDEKAIQNEVHLALASELGRTTWQELSPVYSAIGNTGDLSFLPDIERASRHPDPDVRASVPIALRRMSIEGTREFELAWLRRETSPDVLRELFIVIHRQHQDLAKVIDDELATEALKCLRKQPQLLTRQVLLMMLQPYVALRDDVRVAFRDQLKIEYEATTGMFSFVASSLPESDVEMALSTIPSLGDQYGTVSSSPSPGFNGGPDLPSSSTQVTP